MAKKNFGFSLTELLVGITIIGVMAATITLSANSMKVTAKHEAEKVAQCLGVYINKANKKHTGFLFKFENNTLTVTNAIVVNVATEYELKASSGCTYASKNSMKLNYNIKQDGSDHITTIKGQNLRITTQSNTPEDDDSVFWIKVTGKGEPYYVVITVFGDTTLS